MNLLEMQYAMRIPTFKQFTLFMLISTNAIVCHAEDSIRAYDGQLIALVRNRNTIMSTRGEIVLRLAPTGEIRIQQYI